MSGRQGEASATTGILPVQAIRKLITDGRLKLASPTAGQSITAGKP